MRSRLLLFVVALVLPGMCLAVLHPNPRRDAVLMGPGLSYSAGQMNLDRFPGEAEMMKRLNQPDVRAWIHALDRAHLQTEYWRLDTAPPTYYGRSDLLLMLQNHGVNVHRLSHSKELQQLLSNELDRGY